MSFGMIGIVIDIIFVGLLGEQFGTDVAHQLKRSLAVRHYMQNQRFIYYQNFPIKIYTSLLLPLPHFHSHALLSKHLLLSILEINADLNFWGLRYFKIFKKRINNNLIMSTPLGEPLLIEVDGQLLNICEVGPNKINLTFDELNENLRHEVVDHELNKINYKTVEASLKGMHPNILKASLKKNPDELYVLTVTVSYQFLPEIREEIILSKREIKAEETEEAAVRSMKNYLKNLKQQIVNMSNVQVLTGEIEPSGNSFETYIKLVHQKTLITWTITLLKPSGTTFKPQLFLYNSITKNRQNTKIVPNEGLYMHHNGEQFTTELRFVVEQSDKYDNALLVLDGNNKGKYIVSMEKVTSA